jgi:hypothetical protein
MAKDLGDGLAVVGRFIYVGGSPSLKVVEKAEVGP